jgi:putative transposase
MKTIHKRDLVTGEIFHILNRGVDKRKIFLTDKDYFRFIHNLFEFNDVRPAFNLGRSFEKSQLIDLRNRTIKPRGLIVEILAFCLMPNHFHLLMRQKKDNGITNFMRKLSVGYANYFNQKYERTGALFQGRYKAVLVNKESHFVHLPYYIHLNPFDLVESDWRVGKIKNYQKAIKFLESYRWSSHLDYIGQKNFPSVTQREFLLTFWGGSENYRKEIMNWLKEMDLTEMKGLILE